MSEIVSKIKAGTLIDQSEVREELARLTNECEQLNAKLRAQGQEPPRITEPATINGTTGFNTVTGEYNTVEMLDELQAVIDLSAHCDSLRILSTQNKEPEKAMPKPQLKETLAAPADAAQTPAKKLSYTEQCLAAKRGEKIEHASNYSGLTAQCLAAKAAGVK